MSLGSCVVGSLRLSHYDDCDASVVARTCIANYEGILIDRGEGAAPTVRGVLRADSRGRSTVP